MCTKFVVEAKATVHCRLISATAAYKNWVYRSTRSYV